MEREISTFEKVVICLLAGVGFATIAFWRTPSPGPVCPVLDEVPVDAEFERRPGSDYGVWYLTDDVFFGVSVEEDSAIYTSIKCMDEARRG